MAIFRVDRLIILASVTSLCAFGVGLDCESVLTTRCPDQGKPVDQRICYTVLYKQLPSDLQECKQKLELKLDFDGPLGGIDIRYRNGRPPDSSSPDLVALAKLSEQFPQMVPEDRVKHLNRLAAIKQQFEPGKAPEPVKASEQESDFSELEDQIRANRRSRHIFLAVVIFAFGGLGMFLLRRKKK